MSEHARTIVSDHDSHPLSLGKYIVGFVSSVVVTLAAYLLVTRGAGWSHNMVVGVISGLAVLQFLVQMVFFLHIGDERKPRWKLLVLALMLGTVLLIVFGSVWIMNNLNYRMTPQQMEHYLKSQDSI
jgi:cytochrome o ubiquinol oxidase operon protein cyoD